MSADPTKLDAQLVVLHVEDEINQALTGHEGCRYESPPQPRDEALTLARVLLGYTSCELNGSNQWICPIAGGRRTVRLTSRGAARDDADHA